MKAADSILFDSRGAFHEAVLTVLASTHECLVLLDHDFHDWPIDGTAACDAIVRLLQGDRRATVRLLVSDPEWLERRAARFGLLRQRFPMAIACRQIPASLASAEGLAIGDDRHLVRRAHRGRFRGRLVLDKAGDIDAQRLRCDALWHESLPCLSPTRLGL
jgi:hypothetical protein